MNPIQIYLEKWYAQSVGLNLVSVCEDKHYALYNIYTSPLKGCDNDSDIESKARKLCLITLSSPCHFSVLCLRCQEISCTSYKARTLWCQTMYYTVHNLLCASEKRDVIMLFPLLVPLTRQVFRSENWLTQTEKEHKWSYWDLWAIFTETIICTNWDIMSNLLGL